MEDSSGTFRLNVLGSFRLEGFDGARVDVNSKRSQALIAMLALSGGGERTRSWLQDRLWGSRAAEQAQASLRRELANLRRILSASDEPLIQSDRLRVWINLKRVWVDARQLELSKYAGDLLEGLDIAGEDGFEDWLREERSRLKQVPTLPVQPVVTAAPQTRPDFQSLPALAILPFANQTGDPGLDLQAEGLAEDLIDRMSRLRWLPIIARSSSFAFRGSDVDVRTAGAELGARYVLEGRLRSEGAGRSLTSALVDAETGEITWSNRIKMEDDAASESLSEMLSGLSSVLGTRIDEQEQMRGLQKLQSDLNVRELIWRGRWHLNRLTREDSISARDCFAQALVQEPNSPEALIQATWAELWDIWANRGSEEQIRAVRKNAQKAILADYEDARGHMLAGIAESWLLQPLRSEGLLRRAIELNPSLTLSYAQLGSTLYLRGEQIEALKMLNFAIRLSPNDRHIFFILGERAMAHLASGHFDSAVADADQSLIRRPAYWHAHVIKINALVRNGQNEAARQALAELENSKAAFDPAFIDWLPFVDRKWNSFLKEGLNRARG